MKILQVMSRFNPQLGGGVDVVANVSKYMVRRGHEVTILTTDYLFDEKYADDLKNEGVDIVCLKHVFFYHSVIFSPKMNLWLKNNLKSYDIVHLNASRSYQNNLIHKYSNLYGVPYVLQAHGSVGRISSYKISKALYDFMYGNKILKEAKKLIALNEKEVTDYIDRRVVKDKIQIIPNGVDLSKYNSLPEKGLFKNKYGVKGDVKVILYLGRLHKSKGIDLILRSYSKLTTELGESGNIILVIVGPDDGIKKELETYIAKEKLSKKVIFTDYISEDEKKTALVDSHFLITPRFYGFPITFVESFACGSPVITTNEGDTLDWIDNFVGYITNYNEFDLKEAMLSLILNDESRTKFSKNAQSLVYNNLNWLNITEKLEYLYLSALEK